MIRDKIFPAKAVISSLNDKKIKLSVCPVCNEVIDYSKYFWKDFGDPIRKGALCPFCKSLERHRLYALYFALETDLYTRHKQRILHFAPEAGLRKLLSAPELQHDYWPVDLDANFQGGIRSVADITAIPFPDGYFDVVIANHVIEHIPNEKLALQEILRVLKRGGVAYINTPVYHLANTLENPAYNTPELRKKYYGQHDHVRKYGLDYLERLRKVFSVVEQINYAAYFSEEEQLLFNISGCHLGDSPETTWNDEIYICKKLEKSKDKEKDFYYQEIQRIYASKSFRIGRFITYIPRKIRDILYSDSKK